MNSTVACKLTFLQKSSSYQLNCSKIFLIARISRKHNNFSIFDIHVTCFSCLENHNKFVVIKVPTFNPYSEVKKFWVFTPVVDWIPWTLKRGPLIG